MKEKKDIKTNKIIKRYYPNDRRFSIFISNKKINLHVCKKNYAIRDVQQTVKKLHSKKNKILEILFLTINLLCLFVIVFQVAKGEGFLSISELINKNLNVVYIILTVCLFVLLCFIEQAKIYNLILKATKKKRAILSYKTFALGRYYDCITPLSLGGEPYQIYYLNKNAIPADTATSIPFFRQIIWQTSYSIISFFFIIYGIFFCRVKIHNIVMIFAILGLLVNVLIVSLVLWLSVSKRIAPKFLMLITKLLHKMHIIKNYKKCFRNVMRFVKNYQKSIKCFATSRGTMAIQIMLSIGGIITNGLLLFCIYLSLTTFVSFNFIDLFSALTFCELASSIMPLPGGTLAAELSFGTIFSEYFSPGILGWALLIWRFFTYYIFILQGFFVYLYDCIIGNKKIARKKLALAKNQISYVNKQKK